jgi:hypothetical protein
MEENLIERDLIVYSLSDSERHLAFACLFTPISNDSMKSALISLKYGHMSEDLFQDLKGFAVHSLRKRG